jgi:hypothetical protein
MKKFTLANVIGLLCFSGLMSGCNTFPIDLGVKEGHFRIENFVQNNRPTKEYVYLMCRFNRPIGFNLPRDYAAGFDVPRQYPAGEHKLWVRADVNKPGTAASKYAFVEFDVSLDEGKSYMLNRERNEEEISVWIEDIQSGEKVSQIKTATLALEPFVGNLRLRQCEEGTV